jgi:phytoene dehydrogenase-like protein
LALSPPDAPVIRELVDGVRLGIRFNAPEKLQYEASAWEWSRTVLGMLPLLGGIQKWTKLTVGELAGRFQSPLIRAALLSVFGPEYSVFYMVLSMLGFMYKGQAGYPVGGSLPLALFLAKRYQQLGGRVRYQARVEKILVEDGRAVGVRLADGSLERADVVISAGDGHATIYKLLDGKYTNRSLRERYESWQPFQSVLFATVGVKRTFPDIPFSVEGNAFELARPVVIAGEEHAWLGVRVHNHDASFAPPGKTVLTSAIFTSYSCWQELENNPAAYAAQKDCVARGYLEALEQIWPGIAADVEMVNVATPITFERITGNWKGSITGWKLTPAQAGVAIPRTLPGLENFWMVGHWVFPGGGLPAGVSTAREVIWKQCRKDRKRFAPR